MALRQPLSSGHKIALFYEGEGQCGYLQTAWSTGSQLGALVGMIPLKTRDERPMHFEDGIFQVLSGDVGQRGGHQREEIKFGQIIRLLHVGQNKLLACSKKKSGATDRATKQVSVQPEDGRKKYVVTKWRIAPRYQVRGEGEKVCDGDQITLQPVLNEKQYLLALGTAQLPGSKFLEVNAAPHDVRGAGIGGTRREFGFTIKAYDTTIRGPSVLRGGDCVMLYHKELLGYLVADPEAGGGAAGGALAGAAAGSSEKKDETTTADTSDLDALPVSVLSDEERELAADAGSGHGKDPRKYLSNGMFIVEMEDALHGGAMQATPWAAVTGAFTLNDNTRFRLRLLGARSPQYLTLRYDAARESAEGGVGAGSGARRRSFGNTHETSFKFRKHSSDFKMRALQESDPSLRGWRVELCGAAEILTDPGTLFQFLPAGDNCTLELQDGSRVILCGQAAANAPGIAPPGTPTDTPREGVVDAGLQQMRSLFVHVTPRGTGSDEYAVGCASRPLQQNGFELRKVPSDAFLSLSSVLSQIPPILEYIESLDSLGRAPEAARNYDHFARLAPERVVAALEEMVQRCYTVEGGGEVLHLSGSTDRAQQMLLSDQNVPRLCIDLLQTQARIGFAPEQLFHHLAQFQLAQRRLSLDAQVVPPQRSLRIAQLCYKLVRSVVAGCPEVALRLFKAVGEDSLSFMLSQAEFQNDRLDVIPCLMAFYDASRSLQMGTSPAFLARVCENIRGVENGNIHGAVAFLRLLPHVISTADGDVTETLQAQASQLLLEKTAEGGAPPFFSVRRGGADGALYIGLPPLVQSHLSFGGAGSVGTPADLELSLRDESHPGATPPDLSLEVPPALVPRGSGVSVAAAAAAGAPTGERRASTGRAASDCTPSDLALSLPGAVRAPPVLLGRDAGAAPAPLAPVPPLARGGSAAGKDCVIEDASRGEQASSSGVGAGDGAGDVAGAGSRGSGSTHRHPLQPHLSTSHRTADSGASGVGNPSAPQRSNSDGPPGPAWIEISSFCDVSDEVKGVCPVDPDGRARFGGAGKSDIGRSTSSFVADNEDIYEYFQAQLQLFARFCIGVTDGARHRTKLVLDLVPADCIREVLLNRRYADVVPDPLRCAFALLIKEAVLDDYPDMHQHTRTFVKVLSNFDLRRAHLFGGCPDNCAPLRRSTIEYLTAHPSLPACEPAKIGRMRTELQLLEMFVRCGFFTIDEIPRFARVLTSILDATIDEIPMGSGYLCTRAARFSTAEVLKPLAGVRVAVIDILNLLLDFLNYLDIHRVFGSVRQFLEGPPDAELHFPHFSPLQTFSEELNALLDEASKSNYVNPSVVGGVLDVFGQIKSSVGKLARGSDHRAFDDINTLHELLIDCAQHDDHALRTAATSLLFRLTNRGDRIYTMCASTHILRNEASQEVYRAADAAVTRLTELTSQYIVSETVVNHLTAVLDDLQGLIVGTPHDVLERCSILGRLGAHVPIFESYLVGPECAVVCMENFRRPYARFARSFVAYLTAIVLPCPANQTRMVPHIPALIQFLNEEWIGLALPLLKAIFVDTTKYSATTSECVIRSLMTMPPNLRFLPFLTRLMAPCGRVLYRRQEAVYNQFIDVWNGVLSFGNNASSRQGWTVPLRRKRMHFVSELLRKQEHLDPFGNVATHLAMVRVLYWVALGKEKQLKRDIRHDFFTDRMSNPTEHLLSLLVRSEIPFWYRRTYLAFAREVIMGDEETADEALHMDISARGRDGSAMIEVLSRIEEDMRVFCCLRAPGGGRDAAPPLSFNLRHPSMCSELGSPMVEDEGGVGGAGAGAVESPQLATSGNVKFDLSGDAGADKRGSPRARGSGRAATGHRGKRQPGERAPEKIAGVELNSPALYVDYILRAAMPFVEVVMQVVVRNDPVLGDNPGASRAPSVAGYHMHAGGGGGLITATHATTEKIRSIVSMLNVFLDEQKRLRAGDAAVADGGAGASAGPPVSPVSPMYSSSQGISVSASAAAVVPVGYVDLICFLHEQTAVAADDASSDTSAEGGEASQRLPTKDTSGGMFCGGEAKPERADVGGSPPGPSAAGDDEVHPAATRQHSRRVPDHVLVELETVAARMAQYEQAMREALPGRGRNPALAALAVGDGGSGAGEGAGATPPSGPANGGGKRHTLCMPPPRILSETLYVEFSAEHLPLLPGAADHHADDAGDDDDVVEVAPPIPAAAAAKPPPVHSHLDRWESCFELLKREPFLQGNEAYAALSLMLLRKGSLGMTFLSKTIIGTGTEGMVNQHGSVQLDALRLLTKFASALDPAARRAGRGGNDLNILCSTSKFFVDVIAREEAEFGRFEINTIRLEENMTQLQKQIALVGLGLSPVLIDLLGSARQAPAGADEGMSDVTTATLDLGIAYLTDGNHFAQDSMMDVFTSNKDEMFFVWIRQQLRDFMDEVKDLQRTIKKETTTEIRDAPADGGGEDAAPTAQGDRKANAKGRPNPKPTTDAAANGAQGEAKQPLGAPPPSTRLTGKSAATPGAFLKEMLFADDNCVASKDVHRRPVDPRHEPLPDDVIGDFKARFHVEHMSKLMRFLQLLCEGHHLGMQNYLRIQAKQTTSLDCVEAVVMFLQRIKYLSRVTSDVTANTLACLLEFLQGPCHGNQRLMVALNIGEMLCKLLNDGDGSRVRKTDLELAADDAVRETLWTIRQTAMDVLVACLEGVECTDMSKMLFENVTLDVLAANMRLSFKTAGFDEQEGLLSSALSVGKGFLRDVFVPIGSGNELTDKLNLGCSVFIFFKVMIDAQKMRQREMGPGVVVCWHDLREQSVQHVLKKEENTCYHYFNRIIATIEISRNNGVERVYFRALTKSTQNLSELSKDRVIGSVTRDAGDAAKVADYFDHCIFLIFEINYMESLRRARGLALIHKFRTPLRWLGLLSGYLINLHLLIHVNYLYDDSRNSVPPGWPTDVLMILGLSSLVLQCIHMFHFLIGPLRVHVRFKWLEWEIEAEEARHAKIKANMGIDDPKIHTQSPGKATQYLRTVAMVATHWALWERLAYLLGSALGYSVSPVFYSLLPLEVIAFSTKLQNVVLAITTHGSTLVMTLGLMIIIVYAFAAWAFFRFSAHMDEDEFGPGFSCDTLFRCWVLLSTYGLRQGEGMGGIMLRVNFDEENAGERLLFDLLFFLTFIIMFLNLVFGIIIDTFAELRQRRSTIEEDQYSKCFVCGMERSFFDRECASEGGFEHHWRNEHNMWTYLFFIHYVLEKETSSLSGQEKYVYDKVIAKDATFFPVAQSIVYNMKQEIGDKVGDEDDDGGGDGGYAPELQATGGNPAHRGDVAVHKQFSRLHRRLAQMEALLKTMHDGSGGPPRSPGAVQGGGGGAGGFAAAVGSSVRAGLPVPGAPRAFGTAAGGGPRVGARSGLSTPRRSIGADSTGTHEPPPTPPEDPVSPTAPDPQQPPSPQQRPLQRAGRGAMGSGQSAT